MNYYHIYHAGNFADILKHTILIFCLEKLCEKPTPFFILDTHAGSGKYDLGDEKSLKTFEANNGIKKIISSQILPSRYLEILARTNCCNIEELPSKLKIYTGSPIIIKNFLRQNDRAILAELNQKEFLNLKRNFAGNQKFSLLNEDGFHLLKSKLPPLEKRGLIIIDPSFEKDQKKISDDYEKIILSLEEGYKRFSSGIYIIWYPIISGEEAILKNFYKKVLDLKFSKVLQVILDIGKRDEEEKMTSCGMFIMNAPWQVDEKLNKILPKILSALKLEDNAHFEVRTHL